MKEGIIGQSLLVMVTTAVCKPPSPPPTHINPLPSSPTPPSSSPTLHLRASSPIPSSPSPNHLGASSPIPSFHPPYPFLPPPISSFPTLSLPLPYPTISGPPHLFLPLLPRRRITSYLKPHHRDAAPQQLRLNY
ncbi:hypothetical protein Pcinc_035148 [Petrolisthes cinctipes]|uniref:Uncharacterized protein n=1 Tax=Petrolisthes cinctipes TaxID=88211 RepID=A0AAE1BYW1_PETCI|nr:hypothetical protein Pcinc_035148 [Petrolisthes cinctipes]